MRRLFQAGLGAAIILAAPACNNDDLLPPGVLTPGDVAGTYQACTIRFVPTSNALPTADLLIAAVDTTPPAGGSEPLLQLNNTGSFTLTYTRLSDAFVRSLGGGAGYGQGAVLLPLSSAVSNELLLPPSLELAFAGSPKRLTAGATENGEYSVDRTRYSQLTGVAEGSLPAQVAGRITASFTTGSCG